MGISPDHPGVRAAVENGLIRPDQLPPAVGGKPAATPRKRASQPPAPSARPRLVVEADALVRTVSEANVTGSVRRKCRRKADVRSAVAAALPVLAAPVPLPVVVTLTRFGPGEVDDDNLTMALKTIRDAVAAWIGVDDRDRRVRWRYRQAPSWVAFVRIRVEHKGG